VVKRAKAGSEWIAFWGVLATLLLTLIFPPFVLWSWPRISVAFFFAMRKHLPRRPEDEFLAILRGVGLLVLSGVLSAVVNAFVVLLFLCFSFRGCR
jgi:hypothetical protein